VIKRLKTLRWLASLLVFICPTIFLCSAVGSNSLKILTRPGNGTVSSGHRSSSAVTHCVDEMKRVMVPRAGVEPERQKDVFEVE
jgi:hypothetical protein